MNLKQIIKTRCKHWTIAEARPKDMQTKEATLLAIKPTCGIKNFTLLEMIVVISIIMVVTGLSFAYMGTYASWFSYRQKALQILKS